MSIEKYTTKAIVITWYDHGEHDRSYKMLTRDFGVIVAHAKSIRKLESKLRAHMSLTSEVMVTLVKGRELWRLVGAEEVSSRNSFFHEVIPLIGRFIQGEGTHKTLYDKLIELSHRGDTYDATTKRLMMYFIILVSLGYADARVAGARDLKEYLSWSVDEMYPLVVLRYEDIRQHVYMVLKEMQM